MCDGAGSLFTIIGIAIISGAVPMDKDSLCHPEGRRRKTSFRSTTSRIRTHVHTLQHAYLSMCILCTPTTLTTDRKHHGQSTRVLELIYFLLHFPDRMTGGALRMRLHDCVSLYKQVFASLRDGRTMIDDFLISHAAKDTHATR